MTVIRVHELAKKMGVESKDLISVLDKMGIKEKTPSSGLDDKEAKSLIEKLKAIRKDKEKEKDKTRKEKEAGRPAVVERGTAEKGSGADRKIFVHPRKAGREAKTRTHSAVAETGHAGAAGHPARPAR